MDTPRRKYPIGACTFEGPIEERYYKVAGQTFALRMEAGDPLWDAMGNYAPFRTDARQEPLLFALDAMPSDPLQGDHLLLEGDSYDEGMPRLDIYSVPAGLRIRMAPTQSAAVCASLDVVPGYTRGSLNFLRRGAKFSLDNSLMLMYAFSSARKGTLEMHASVVADSDGAYMFLGESGAGKSTHSRMWLEGIPGTVLVNDDNPIVRVGPDGAVMVCGSPWSGKTPCYKNMEMPLKAAVSIKKAPRNALKPLDIFESYSLVYSSCSGFRSDPALADGMHENIERFLQAVPCYELECLPDTDAARTCRKEIKKHSI